MHPPPPHPSLIMYNTRQIIHSAVLMNTVLQTGSIHSALLMTTALQTERNSFGTPDESCFTISKQPIQYCCKILYYKQQITHSEMLLNTSLKAANNVFSNVAQYCNTSSQQLIQQCCWILFYKQQITGSGVLMNTVLQANDSNAANDWFNSVAEYCITTNK